MLIFLLILYRGLELYLSYTDLRIFYISVCDPDIWKLDCVQRHRIGWRYINNGGYRRNILPVRDHIPADSQRAARTQNTRHPDASRPLFALCEPQGKLTSAKRTRREKTLSQDYKALFSFTQQSQMSESSCSCLDHGRVLL